MNEATETATMLKDGMLAAKQQTLPTLPQAQQSQVNRSNCSQPDRGGRPPIRLQIPLREVQKPDMRF